MKAKMGILFAVALMLTLLPVGALAHTGDDPFVTDLTAGGGNMKSAMDVGDVEVWNDGEYLYVKYVVTDEEWCLTETHLHVFLDNIWYRDIPHKNGNPIPGRFAYKGRHDCVDGVTYTIPLAWDPGTEIFIAAHGVVQTGGLNGLELTLPDQVTMYAMWPGLGFGDPSYLDAVVSGGTTLDGTYDGYCLDHGSGIPLNPVTANVYSSTEPLPPSVRIDKPENLDLVNWIINQGFVGQPSGCGGNYTYGDVQWVIWNLLQDEEPSDGAIGSLGDWSECRAQEILAAAYYNGEGFVPGCGDVVGIILDSVEWHQPVLIWVPVPCPEDETVWGGDYFGTPMEFPGRNWAIYFAYTVQVQGLTLR
jgi:hypothetical protein